MMATWKGAQPQYEYDLKLANGTTVIWPGTTPEDAARRAEDCLRLKVLGWRWPVVDVIVGMDHPRLREHPFW